MSLSISGRVAQALQRGPTTAKARVVHHWCREHPEASIGQVVRATGCSQTTAKVWVRVAQIEAGLRSSPIATETPSPKSGVEPVAVHDVLPPSQGVTQQEADPEPEPRQDNPAPKGHVTEDVAGHKGARVVVREDIGGIW